MEGLVEGRVVHFVLGDHASTDGTRDCRAAVIVNAWNGILDDGMVNLKVLLDGNNDYGLVASKDLLKKCTINKTVTEGNSILDYLWLTSVKYSENKEVGTWHWSE